MSKKKGCLYIALGLVVLLTIAAIASYLYFNESKPQGTNTNGADQLAIEMLDNMNKTAYDTTRYFQWTFFRPNHYKYDKFEEKAWVSWDDKLVYVDLKTSKGIVIEPKGLSEEEQNKLAETAWANWCNDSFWLFAPFKVFDGGTTRTIVKTDEAEHGLMVTYDNGGVTPGDSYLWLLDANKRPTGYKMWVSIIPVGGLYASWSNWKEYAGIWLASDHKIGPAPEASISNIKAGHSIEEMGWEPSDVRTK